MKQLKIYLIVHKTYDSRDNPYYANTDIAFDSLDAAEEYCRSNIMYKYEEINLIIK